MELPPEGSRERGIVRRLEPYGAFVELERFPRLRGLVHISEMAEYRVEKPEDVVSCEDFVWVKVLSANSEEVDGRVRHRIQLSMKDVDNASSSRPRSQATQQLESNLSSTIGMGFAKDPMSHLIMKHEHSGTVINGYALVDADEGEPERPLVKLAPHPMELGRGSTSPAWMTTKNGARSQGVSNEGPRPMGRGRGATLPAWMTRGDGPVAGEERKRSDDSLHEKHHRKVKKKHSRKHNRDRDDSRQEHRREKDRRRSPSGNDREESQNIRRSKKHHRKDHESRQHSASGSNEDEPRTSRHSMKHHRSIKDRKSRRRSDSGSDIEEPQDSHHTRKHHRREEHESRRRSDSGSGRVEPRDSRRSRKHHRSEDCESRRRSPSRDKDHSDGRDSRLTFGSVDEAKELIAELERTRRNRRDRAGSDNEKRSHARRGNHADSKRPKRRRRDSRVYSDDSGTDESSKHGRHRRKGSDHAS